jgi:hypothetical protein
VKDHLETCLLNLPTKGVADAWYEGEGDRVLVFLVVVVVAATTLVIVVDVVAVAAAAAAATVVPADGATVVVAVDVGSPLGGKDDVVILDLFFNILESWWRSI